MCEIISDDTAFKVLVFILILVWLIWVIIVSLSNQKVHMHKYWYNEKPTSFIEKDL